jgi:D-glutamate cyclase
MRVARSACDRAMTGPHGTARDRIDRIEALIHQDVGRNAGALFAAARGGLFKAVSALAAADRPKIGLLTGFYVPMATPPAAETDGPAGAAMLARALVNAGIEVRLLTDTLCRSACLAAVSAAGISVPVDCVAPDQSLSDMITAWRDAGITWAISIERCGRSAGGPPRNMRGEDLSRYVAPLDELFAAGPWQTIAIGDGGNEIGMGSLPRPLITASVANGETIACVTPADHLIVAGVSHWGAHALIAGLAVLRPDWRATCLDCLDETLEKAILTTMVREGPAVDGVTLSHAVTVDGLDLAVHGARLRAIRAVAQG